MDDKYSTSNGLTIQNIQISLPEKGQIQIALLSDTHTSHQNPNLHPNLLPALRKLQPDLILHAGDITIPETLPVLSQIAPVYAVRGNRDWPNRIHLPDAIHFSVNKTKLFLTHGHGPTIHYLIDKIKYIVSGFKFSRYQSYLTHIAADAHIIVFGHTHTIINQRVGRQLFINPGAACLPCNHDPNPSYGWLTIHSNQPPQARIFYLK